VTTLMGKSAFPGRTSCTSAGRACTDEVSNLAMNTCDVLVAIGARFDDPRDGESSRRSRPEPRSSIWTSTRRRSRSCARPTSPSWGRCRPPSVSSRTPSWRSAQRARPCPRRGSRSSATGARVPAPLRHERGVAQAAAGRAGAAAPHRRHGHDRHHGRRPAPDVGDAVRPLRAARAASSPRAGSGRWATGSRCDRRQGGAPRGDRGLRRRRRLLPDDRPRSSSRPCSRTCRSWSWS
jgi:hypothetical protein